MSSDPPEDNQPEPAPGWAQPGSSQPPVAGVQAPQADYPLAQRQPTPGGLRLFEHHLDRLPARSFSRF